MKAILVVDKMPKRCLECGLIWDEINNGIVRCSNGSLLDDNDILKEKPSWCPLKPMPQKKETRSAIQYSGLAEEYRKEGWNECLEEIEK